MTSNEQSVQEIMLSQEGTKERPWQLMPALTEAEYNMLKEDIRSNGVLVAIDWDDKGHILDGHHRLQAWEELRAEGLDLPPPDKIIRRGWPEQKKRDHVIALNLKRRHLTDEQRTQIFLELRRQGRTLEDIAQLANSNSETVRQAIIQSGAQTPAYVQGKDGIMRPTQFSRRSVIASERTVREEAAEARREAKAKLPDWLPEIGARYIVRQGNFTEALANVEGVAKAIITDPPYGKEYLVLYQRLADFAEYALVDGGLLLAMAGQMYLPDVLYLMTHREDGSSREGVLTYVWTIAFMLPGANAKVFQRGALCGWKAVILMVKGVSINTEEHQYYDVVKSAAPDKEFHEWGQNLAAFEYLVNKFTYPGDIVIDPMVGGGTTGVATVDLNRIFVGCDIDPEAVKISKIRMAEAVERGNNAVSNGG